jgi:3'(2'), 5'-bisphosphate nucleotidase
LNIPADLEALAMSAQQLAWTAGALILGIYESDYEIESKHDETPVTTADLAAHDAIVEGLAELTPNVPVLSEESAGIPFATRSRWQHYWLVDPLDGTREFIKHTGEFTVNLALVGNHRPLLGIIHAPVTGVTYFAWNNGGAYKFSDGVDEAHKIYTRPLEDAPVRVAGSRGYAVKSLQTFLRRLDNYEYVGVGAALKPCLIAEGSVDVYPRLGPTSEWDTAAAQCILEEAGGKFTDLHLQPLRYNTKPSLTNPPFIAFGDDRRNWIRYIPEQFLEPRP